MSLVSGHGAGLASASTAWADELWDEELGLVRHGELTEWHGILQTVFYALALLIRGDHPDRAASALGVALGYQYDEPGTVYHGTFARFHQEAHPPPDAQMWLHYDPNWRQFAGTTLALMRMHFELGRDLERRIDRAIVLCVDGEPPDRVPATYSNIALMRSWLDAWEGKRRGDGALVERADALAGEVYELFSAHDAFEEYNSPTYYGVDLYALGLWRRWGTPSMQAWGSEMEAALWHDIARFYHPGLGNLCGPYDRAYGMDMGRYAGLVGLWFWIALGRDHAPWPDPSRGFEHAHDFMWGPLAALVGTEVPPEVERELMTFSTERLVERPVSGGRLATAWLATDVMLGGMDAGRTRGGWEQYHPATVHWRRTDGSVGWIRLRPPGAADAAVSPGELSATCVGAGGRDIVLEVSGDGALTGERFELDGLSIEVGCSGDASVVDTDRDTREVRYPGPAPGDETRITLSPR